MIDTPATNRYFIISLIIQQLYREMLYDADEYGGLLPNRVIIRVE